jgi:asparagine N-glycosylation enzyme membrane subunit Stt3
MNYTLLVIFAIHFAVFVYLAYRTRKGYFLFAAITFVLLIISLSMRKWMPHLHIAEIPIHWFVRICAWICVAIGLVFIIRDKIKKHTN